MGNGLGCFQVASHMISGRSSRNQTDVPEVIERATVTADALQISRLECGGYRFKYTQGSAIPCVITDPQYNVLKVCSRGSGSQVERLLQFLVRTAYECQFARQGVVSLHAACVELGDGAVCFTGDSGVGKSTRAQAWVDGVGAQLISGDRPAIRLEAACNIACGVPWDGKEQILRDVERPLKAVLEVRRAPFTRLRRLTPEQAYAVLIRQSFIPMWDTDAAALAMTNVRRLSRTTPVYRLFCGPNAEHARAAHCILFEHPDEIGEERPDMNIKEGFVLRTVADEHMVMPTGENIGRFGGAVVLNDVSAFAFEQLKRPISREDLLALILGEFDVDETTASEDLDSLLEQFRELGLLKD